MMVYQNLLGGKHILTCESLRLWSEETLNCDGLWNVLTLERWDEQIRSWNQWDERAPSWTR